MEDRALILAGGSAIGALTSLNIMPHLLYAIDPNLEEFTRLAFHTAYDVPLIFGCRVEPSLFASHAGPIGYLSTGTGGALENWIEKRISIKDFGVLEHLSEEALSVTALVVKTAIYFGCNPIILAGVDLSYGKRQSRYVEGAVHIGVLQEDAHTVWLNGIETTTKWLMERDVLDRLAETYRDRRCIKASLDGLPFQHISHDPKWALKKGDKKDFSEMVYRQVRETIFKIDAKEIEKGLALFFKSMRRAKGFVQEIFFHLDLSCKEKKSFFAKIALLEMDLEEEVAFQVALKPTTFALYLFSKRSYRFLEDTPQKMRLIKREVYRKMEAIIDEYLALW